MDDVSLSLREVTERRDAVRAEIEQLNVRMHELEREQRDLSMMLRAFTRLTGVAVDPEPDVRVLRSPVSWRDVKRIEESLSEKNRHSSNRPVRTNGELTTSEQVVTEDQQQAAADQGADVVSPEGVVQIKRIRSTDMVADLLRNAATELSRDEVHLLFESTYGYPPTWRNPANAINNALARATERGDILMTPKGTYVYRGGPSV